MMLRMFKLIFIASYLSSTAVASAAISPDLKRQFPDKFSFEENDTSVKIHYSTYSSSICPLEVKTTLINQNYQKSVGEIYFQFVVAPKSTCLKSFGYSEGLAFFNKNSSFLPKKGLYKIYANRNFVGEVEIE